MQEMVEISKMQSQQTEAKPQAVTFVKPNTNPPQIITLLAGPAQFGLELQGLNKVTGKVVFTFPSAACTDLHNADKLAGKIAIMGRGNCMFIEKVNKFHPYCECILKQFLFNYFNIIAGKTNSTSRCCCWNSVG